MARSQQDIEADIGLQLANAAVATLTKSLALKELECNALKVKLAELTAAKDTPTPPEKQDSGAPAAAGIAH